MTDPVEPPRDDWRTLALDICGLITGADSTGAQTGDLAITLAARRDALLAVEEHRDEHPPTFHLREHVVGMKGMWPRGEDGRRHMGDHPGNAVEWSWSCVEANGLQIAWSSETYVDRDHTLEMARKFARGFPGARIIDQEGNEL